jgi:hypothetical protein
MMGLERNADIGKAPLNIEQVNHYADAKDPSIQCIIRSFAERKF